MKRKETKQPSISLRGIREAQVVIQSEKVKQKQTISKKQSSAGGAEFEKLMGDLKKQLTALSKSHEPEARRVMKAAESVAEEVANEKKSPSYLRVTLDGLKKAAETVKDVAPNVIVTASKIADFVHQWWPS
jgi:hypothetical protein